MSRSRTMTPRNVARVLALVALLAPSLAAQTPGHYLLPPQSIIDIVDAPPIPQAIVSPSRQLVALLQRRTNPPIAELAQPWHGLAGVRVNPKTNGPRRTSG